MPTRQLTSARLKNLKPPVKGVTELRDGLARGLALRVFSSGRATWTFRYRPKGGGARRQSGLGTIRPSAWRRPAGAPISSGERCRGAEIPKAPSLHNAKSRHSPN